MSQEEGKNGGEGGKKGAGWGDKNQKKIGRKIQQKKGGGGGGGRRYKKGRNWRPGIELGTLALENLRKCQ